MGHDGAMSQFSSQSAQPSAAQPVASEAQQDATPAGVSLWVRDLLTLLLVLVIRGFAIVYNWNLPDIAIRRKP